jgi:hypothetical protein
MASFVELVEHGLDEYDYERDGGLDCGLPRSGELHGWRVHGGADTNGVRIARRGAIAVVAVCLVACTAATSTSSSSSSTPSPDVTPSRVAGTRSVQVTSQAVRDCGADTCVVVKVVNTGTVATGGICGPWLPNRPPPSIGIPGTYKRVGLLEPGASRGMSFGMRHLKSLGVKDASTVKIRCVPQDVVSQAASA